MKLTKPILKQIIRESLEDENNDMKTKLFQLYFNPDYRQQAIELANSIGTPIDYNFFVGVNLAGMDLSGTDLKNINLSSANLKGANLKGAGLRKANLSGADLKGANLSYTDLSSADMTGANMTDANLENAYLDFTNLSNANLTNAILNGALLYTANTNNTNMTNVAYDKYTSFMTPKLRMEESKYLDKYSGYAGRRPDFNQSLSDNMSAFKDAVKFINNMALYYGAIEDDIIKTNPSDIAHRYYNTRIIPDEWVRGNSSDPEIKDGGSWRKLSEFELKDWVRFKRWKPVELDRGYGRNVKPIQKV
jgi:hypothetical protein|tara:strand:- start:2945 stop:3859 length:915 start_codon:yes stop_codon:yes gene_type:complete